MVFYQKWAIYFLKWLESQCIKNSAAVVTVGEGIAQLQKQTFGRAGIVLRNCQDSRLDKKPLQHLRDKLELTTNEFLLVIVGQAKPGQAIREVLEAISRMPINIHIALIGNNYEQYQSVIKKYQINQRVHLIPTIKSFEVVPFIKSADASLLLYYPHSLNYLNCLPNGFFQPISAGLPILYSDALPEIKKIAEQYQLGIPINPKSPESINAAIMELIQAPEQLSRYKQNSQRASQILNWENEEVILKDLLAEILEI
jgi:glycosyltransferase involved in cell wall biosynthesis